MNGPIFLIGLPGCGKSTVGKIVAKDLGFDFCDSDQTVLELVHHDHPQISELLHMYAAIGNQQFREYEYSAQTPERVAREIEGLLQMPEVIQ